MSILAAIETFLSTAQILSIPEHRNEEFLKAIKSFGRKAQKLGVEAPVAKAFSSETMPMPKSVSYYGVAEDGSLVKKYRIEQVPCYVYLLGGLTPRVSADHSLCARVDFDPGTGVILVNTVPGAVVPERYRAGTNHCDHCGKVRNRKAAYVLKVEATGECIQVGGQCLLDYLGKSSVAALTFKYEAMETFSADSSYGDFEDEGDDQWGSSKYTNTRAYLGCVLQTMEAANGVYVSKSNAYGSTPTAELAGSLYSKLKADKLPAPKAAESEALVTKALEILGAKETLSDYEHNLKALLSVNLFSKGHGYLASVPGYVSRFEAEKVEKATKVESKFRGTVGKREEFELVFVRTHSFESSFGVCNIHRFRDREGNEFTWKSSTSVYRLTADGRTQQDAYGVYVDAVAGDVFTVTATVKAHEVYKGSKQTVITRANLTAMI